MANDIEPGKGVPLNAPIFTPSSFLVQGTQTELALLGLQTIFGNAVGNDVELAGTPVVQINLNYVLAKQLSMILSAALQKYEGDFGEINPKLLPIPTIK